jgi:hypothetical protein
MLSNNKLFLINFYVKGAGQITKIYRKIVLKIAAK